MAAVRDRALELTSTVTLHKVKPSEVAAYAEKLSLAVGSVLQEYPSVSQFLVAPDLRSGDIDYGLRFIAVDPMFAEDVADEILEKAVKLVADRDGGPAVDAEREGSILIPTR